MTSATEIGFWNCAIGFLVPNFRFFTATAATCSRVVP